MAFASKIAMPIVNIVDENDRQKAYKKNSSLAKVLSLGMEK